MSTSGQTLDLNASSWETSMRRTRLPGGRLLGQSAIYIILIVWAFISLFPIYWTFTTSFKTAVKSRRGTSSPSST